MSMELDRIELREFYRAGFEVTPENTEKLKTYEFGGRSKLEQTFTEFFVNDNPLSQIIMDFCGIELKPREVWSWVGAFGYHLTKPMERIKVNQLLLKSTSEKEIIDSLLPKFEKNHLNALLKQYKRELSNPKVLIYVCSECGDYDCGGIAISITKSEDYFQWVFENDEEGPKNAGQQMTLKFNKHEYFKVFDDYLKSKNYG